MPFAKHTKFSTVSCWSDHAAPLTSKRPKPATIAKTRDVTEQRRLSSSDAVSARMLYGRGLNTLELLGDLHWGGHRIEPMPSKLCAGAPMSSRSDGTCELKEIAALGGVANCQAWRSVPSEGAAQWSPRRGMMMRWWVSAGSLRTGPAFLGVVAVVGPRSIPRALSRPPSPRPGRRCTTARARAGESTSATGWPIRLVVPATRSRGARACRARPYGRGACPAWLLASKLAWSDSVAPRVPIFGGEPALAGGTIASGGAHFADSGLLPTSDSALTGRQHAMVAFAS